MRWSVESLLDRLPLSAVRDVGAKSPSTGTNLDALDGVRGLAVLIVIFAHTHSLGMSKHGGAGVWLFYCLSGFLLTLPFARNSGLIWSRGHLAHYFERRVRRIFPAYYVWLGLWFLLYLQDKDQFMLHAGFMRADGHLWSIPQELVFYLVLPLFVVGLQWVLRCRIGYMAAMLVATTIAAYSPLAQWLPALPGGYDGTTRFMLGNFVAGMGSAYMVEWLRARPEFPSRAVFVIAVTVSVLGAIVLVTTSPYFVDVIWLPLMPEAMKPYLTGILGWRYPWLYAAASAAFVAGLVLAPGSTLARIVSVTPLRLVGIVSFSMYLVHAGVVHVLKAMGWPDGIKLAIGVAPITLVLAMLSYHYVERPFLFGAARTSRVRTVAERS